MNQLELLQQRFNCPSVRFVAGRGGFICLEVANRHAEAILTTHGAHLMNFTPNDERPVLWMSEQSYFEAGKPIRGGVPVCWPWFGGSPRAGEPAHGFARLSDWNVDSVTDNADGETEIVLMLTPDEAATPELVHFAFRLTMRFTIGRALTMALTMENRSAEPQEITDALHSYFAVSAVEQIAVTGLEGCSYLDKVPGAKITEGLVQDGAIKIAQEVDRVYLDTDDIVEIEDPAWNRAIRIAKSGSRSTVVWNPWVDKSKRMPDFGDEEFHSMLCIEATNAANDRRIVAPGESHTITQRCECIRL